ncbi:MoaD/ThiS family protein [Candidatus Bathyarchaeota archaeon]|nr:MoaD/ThiS family protein [Candidatus Bathyarchaeota archaeon]
MSIKILLYGNLASIAGISSTNIDANTVSQLLDALAIRYGEVFREKLYDSNGKPRRFINIYVNGKDYRFLKKSDTEIFPNDEVSLIPAVSGG